MVISNTRVPRQSYYGLVWKTILKLNRTKHVSIFDFTAARDFSETPLSSSKTPKTGLMFEEKWVPRPMTSTLLDLPLRSSVGEHPGVKMK